MSKKDKGIQAMPAPNDVKNTEMSEWELNDHMGTLEKAAKIKGDPKLMKKLKKHHKAKTKAMAKEFKSHEADDHDEDDVKSISDIREKSNKKAMKEYE